MPGRTCCLKLQVTVDSQSGWTASWCVILVTTLYGVLLADQIVTINELLYLCESYIECSVDIYGFVSFAQARTLPRPKSK